MTPQSLLGQQLAGYHDILEQTIADCAQETLDRNLPNATITNIGSIYAHIIFSEDGRRRRCITPRAGPRG